MNNKASLIILICSLLMISCTPIPTGNDYPPPNPNDEYVPEDPTDRRNINS